MGQDAEELSRNIEETRQNLSQDVDELTDKVSPSRIAQRKKDAARSRLGALRDQVMGTAHDSRQTLSSAGQDVGDTASGAVQNLEQRTQGNPLGAGLVAFGTGMVIASLLPASKAETQASQRAMDVAKEQGQPLLDEAKSAGQEMAENLRETATQAAQEVKATAQESAEQVKGEAQSSGEHVRDATPGA